jgi:preprotein translocase subunit SecA
LGGLYVLGTERHESRRIDNQLRGRSGRQGDPGESRFYLSLQDDLMRLFNSGLTERILSGVNFPEDVPLESKMVTRGIASAQSQVEARNFEIRKNVLKYDDVMSRQRTVVYAERRRILKGEDLADQIQSFLTDVIKAVVESGVAEEEARTWDLDALWTQLRAIFPVSITPDDVVAEAGGLNLVTQEMLERELLADARLAYQTREERLGAEIMRQLERRVLLSVLDRKWREHLYEMDYLKEGIGLRAMAQRDPLVEYQREGYQLFQIMNEAIKEEAIGYLFNLRVQVDESDDEEEIEETDADDDFAVTLAASARASAPSTTVPGTAPSDLAAATAKAAEEAAAKASKAAAKAKAKAKAKASGKAAGKAAGKASGQAGGKAAATTATKEAASSAPEVSKPAKQGGKQGGKAKLDESSLGGGPRAVPLQYSAPSDAGDGSTVTAGSAFGKRSVQGPTRSAPAADGLSFPGTPRNAQCPCGSGKKYKLCHGRND